MLGVGRRRDDTTRVTDGRETPVDGDLIPEGRYENTQHI